MKTWKDTLLSTGLPLEYAVRQKTAQLGLTSSREFSYLRHNEYGQPTEFSVDVSTSLIGSDGPVFFWIDYLIECKYRKEGTRWIFVPSTADFGRAQRLALPTLDHLTEVEVDLTQIRGTYKFADKGCEVCENDRNSKSIEQAVHQLRYAVPNVIRDALEHQVDHLLGSRNPVWIVLPVIVTTAEIWCLRERATIEAIKSSSDLSEVADRHETLVLHRPPDNLLSRYTRELLRASFDDKQQVDALDAGMREGGRPGWDTFVTLCSALWPSQFVVVTIERLEDLLQNFSMVFNDAALYKEKTF